MFYLKTVLTICLTAILLSYAVFAQTPEPPAAAVAADTAQLAPEALPAVPAEPAEPLAPEAPGTVDRREIGNLVLENIPEIPQELQDKYQQYQNVRAAGFQGWDAKGEGIFISTRFAETGQIHYVAMPGGARSQLTFFPEPARGAAVRPDSLHPGFIFSMDAGGSENSQLYYFNQTDGSYQMLTDGESMNSGVLWTRDGKKFAYVSNKRNKVDFDIYLADMENPTAAKMIYEGKGHWGARDWSPDHSMLLLSNYISSSHSRLFILDLASGRLTPLLTAEGEYSMGGGAWRADDRKIYFTSDFEGEFSKLYAYDIKDDQPKIMTKKIDWDVEGMTISPDGKTLAFKVNENGADKLYLMNTFTNWYSPVSNLPPGSVSGMEFNPVEDKLAFTMNTPQSPGDAFVLDLKTKRLTQWTFSETGGLNPQTFIIPQLIEYATYDTVLGGQYRKIPAYYFKPQGEGPFPVVIYLHGGPEGQFTPYFSSAFNFWLNEMGIAVIAPNVRGSSGYGKTFLKMDNDTLRENSVKDAGALLDWIASQPELNKDKVAVFGGSYGGYMVLAMMTHYNDRIAAGVDMVGISNFVTFLENTSGYRQDLRRVEYGDERLPEMREFLQKISPLNNAANITKPLFVGQGLNDPRVPASEAEQIAAAIRANGGEVWYMLAKDEGHGFQKKSNRDYYYLAVALFFEQYLLK